MPEPTAEVETLPTFASPGGGDYVSVTTAYQIATIYAYRGETDKAFEWLDRAYRQRDGGLTEIKGDPLLRNIEKDPLYRAFLQKMKLPLD
jgi:hypothetical protein